MKLSLFCYRWCVCLNAGIRKYRWEICHRSSRDTSIEATIFFAQHSTNVYVTNVYCTATTTANYLLCYKLLRFSLIIVRQAWTSHNLHTTTYMDILEILTIVLLLYYYYYYYYYWLLLVFSFIMTLLLLPVLQEPKCKITEKNNSFWSMRKTSRRCYINQTKNFTGSLSGCTAKKKPVHLFQQADSLHVANNNCLSA